MTCWIDSSPFGTVDCTFDKDSYTFVLMDINPYGALRGGSTLLVELKGFKNRDVAASTSTFTVLSMTEEDYMIDQVLEGLTVAANCDWPCWECPLN